MIPLFCVPDDGQPDPSLSPGRQATRPPGRGGSGGRSGGGGPGGNGARGRRADPRANSSADPRANPRRPSGRAQRGATGTSGPGKEPADLLTITTQRLRRALARSFLRYGIPGDMEIAVHAAMNVIEPVLAARDTEILRLRRLMTAKLPGR